MLVLCNIRVVWYVVGEVNVTVRMRGKVTKALGESAPRHCCAPPPPPHCSRHICSGWFVCTMCSHRDP